MVGWIGRLFKFAVPVALLAGGVLGTALLRATKPEVAPSPARERVWVVAATPVRIADFRPDLRVFGTIIARRDIELRALVAGQVVAVGANAVEGGVLRAGELVTAIDPKDYELALAERQARLAEARARLTELRVTRESDVEMLVHDRRQLALARRDVERREKLRGKAAVSQKALDDSRMALSRQQQIVLGRGQSLAAAAARIEQQQAVVRRLGVGVARAGRDLANTRLVAPVDGYLVDYTAGLGKRLKLADRVARLIDAASLEAHVRLSDAQFGRVIAGGGGLRKVPAKVLWRVGARELVFDAVIERMSGSIDAASGGVAVYARILGGDALGLLRPGAFVTVTLADAVYAGVARLPEGALAGTDTVYAVVDGRLRPRRVVVAARVGADILVRGDIADGDMIATTRFPEIAPGVRVMVR